MKSFVRTSGPLMLRYLSLLTLVAVFPALPLFGQQNSYNFGTVSSVPATGNGRYLNLQYTVMEMAKNPSSSGPFSCAWAPQISDGQYGPVIITFKPVMGGTYNGSCSIQYYVPDQGKWVTATMTLSGTYQSK